MKVAICDDLHLEWGPIREDAIKNRDNGELLLIAGDTLVASCLNKGMHREIVLDFFDQIANEYPRIVMVMGNHEHYHGNFNRTADILRELLKTQCSDRIELLEKESTFVNGIKIIGGTLWTDMNRRDILTMLYASKNMNDFDIIKIGTRRFTPEDSVIEHINTVAYIEEELKEKVPTIVITHHIPTFQGATDRYGYYSDGCYRSSLDELILDNTHIQLWACGHSHDPIDVMVGSTRVKSNPRGYSGLEPIASQFRIQFVDIFEE